MFGGGDGFSSSPSGEAGVGLRLCTIVHIIYSMNYEWDPKKAKSNYKKHGVKFSDAVGVLEDENAITIED